ARGGRTRPSRVPHYRTAAAELTPSGHAAPTARRDDIDAIAHAEHHADGGTVSGRYQLDRRFRQTGRAQPFGERRDQRARRVIALGPAPQDRGIARFEGEPAGIRSNVGSAFVDYADDTERDRDPLYGETVRPRPSGEDAADRVGQCGDHLEAGGDGFDAFGIESEPVMQRRRETPILGLG